MDTATSLVQAYLRINGFFTVTEFPVVQALADGGHRVVTDLDLLAVRFAGAARTVPHEGRPGHHDDALDETDPILKLDDHHNDMLIGEVKQGRAEINRAATDPTVLHTVLTRFGCCPPEQAPSIVEDLIRRGESKACGNNRIRLIAFGSFVDPKRQGNHEVIELKQVVGFLRHYVERHWLVLRHAEFKDPAMSFLMTMMKTGALGRSRDSSRDDDDNG